MAQNIKNKSFGLIAKKNKTYVMLAIFFVIFLLTVTCLVFIFSIRTIRNISSSTLTVPTNVVHFNINKAQNNPRLLDEFWNDFNYNLLFISPNPNEQETGKENLNLTPELTLTPTPILESTPTITITTTSSLE